MQGVFQCTSKGCSFEGQFRNVVMQHYNQTHRIGGVGGQQQSGGPKRAASVSITSAPQISPMVSPFYNSQPQATGYEQQHQQPNLGYGYDANQWAYLSALYANGTSSSTVSPFQFPSQGYSYGQQFQWNVEESCVITESCDLSLSFSLLFRHSVPFF